MINSHLKKINRTSNYNFDRSNYLRLDRNERTIPFSKKTLEEFKKNISSDIIQSYPMEINTLKTLLSKKEKINKKYINIIPGTDTAIKYLFEIFSDKKKSIASIYPTYGMIDVYSKVYKYKLVKVNLDKNKIDLEKFFKKKVSFIYIANPNQPSGKYIVKNNILKIIKKAKKKGIYVIIDEAYIDFSDFKSIALYVKKFENLIVLKSLSKSFGVAGLRIGYMIANKKVNQILNTVRPIYDLSSFSIKVAEYLLKNIKIANSFINEIKSVKEKLIEECKKRKLKFESTQTNFFYILLPGKKIKKIHNYMFKNKILIRSNYLGPFKNYSNSIRITIGSEKQMVKFFTFFDKIYRRI